MISSFLTILFILAALLFISKLKIRYKIYLLIASFVFSLLVLFKVSPTNELKSLVSFKHLLNGYKLERQRIAEREINFGIQDIKVALYNPEVKQNGLKQTIQVKPDEPQVDLERVKPALEEIVVVSSSLKDPEAEVIQARIRELKDKVGKNEATLSKNQLNTQEGLNSLYRNAKGVVRILEDKSSILSLEDIRKIERAKTLLGELSVIIDKSQAKSKAKPITRNLDGANTSSLFRIFIWEDMIKQLIEEKPLLGFDFGKPLRSKNIEILYLAEADWKACGWITPHNSYLHAVYRAGVVGLLYVIIIYIFLLIMIKNFISLRSVKGILLSGSVMVWLIAANFFVIFELPYSAIPFWSLFGMSWAYLSGLNRKLNSQRRKM
ncbi:MAG: O-antigen ligase family protein [Candidatus Omnitrophica bacterium]|nr:O-antigen ligase family protein [Candidatus Omnitrophota bacterium]